VSRPGKGITHYSRCPFNATQEAKKLEEASPALSGTSYRVTSGSTKGYNCVAWVAGDDTRWWEPVAGFDAKQLGGYYWPTDPEIPAWFSVSALEKLFASQGYEQCDDGDHIPGVEKIAIYGYSRADATHVARQLSSGAWTSKMGRLADIEHECHDQIEGGMVAQIQQFMSRPVTASGNDDADQSPALIVSTQRPAEVADITATASKG
jgi:hypothetical protein